MTVPVVRRICRHALQTLGVGDECVADIELALTEACTNVLKHAMADDLYEIEIEIEPLICVIRVIDAGAGFEPAPDRELEVDTGAEGGRGVGLMAVLVDRLSFEAKPPTGTVVELSKSLAVAGDSVLRRGPERHPAAAGSD